MSYRNSTDYEGTYDSFLFVKNLQGDIIKVLDDEGDLLASYSYDAWGNPTSTTYSNSGASTAVIYNPFRYRGYYYDSEIGFYYLNTRYYNPIIGRFISPDSTDILTATPMALTDKNLYAYCDSNPILRIDTGGDFWHVIVGGILGGVVSGVVSAITQKITTGTVDWRQVGVSAASGAISGALASTGLGVAAQVGLNALVSGAESIASQAIENQGFNNIDYGEVALSAVIGGVSNRNSGLSNGTAKHLMNEGVKTLKQVSKKGLIKTARYYLSQTATLFYKPLLKNSMKDLITDTISDITDYYIDQGIERIRS